MSEIIPAILEKNFEEIENNLGLILGATSFVQIDVCDGFFVPSKSWPFDSASGKPPYDKIFAKIMAQEEGLPYWEDIDYEFDLMVKNPAKKIPDFISAGASRIVVHIDSANDDEIENILNEYSLPAGEAGTDEMRDFGVEIGLAISATTNMERAEKFIPQAAFVQCMGIKKIGFQDQLFDEDVIDRIISLRQKFPELTISVDGGVSEDTISSLVMAGANRLIIGSAIWDSETPADEITNLQEMGN